MDAARFDILARSLGNGASRRALVAGVLAALGFQANSAAKKKNRKNTLKKNAFGCVNVGGKCRGKDNNCCSGICKGKKPKKGERDKSKCAAHDASTCQVGQQINACGGANVPCVTTAGETGGCNTTTGNGAYCLNDLDCFPCRRDTDCEPFCGEGAACVLCGEACGDTGGTACAGTSNCAFS